ncbi:F-box/WD repeat-containing protein 7 [Elysia marginata]|uniref:F-box/WD repeat-containing protein 7 n=1 Tax=Elysia marginata TaxID=1093978 RepID=A0AAV4FSR2_9GAST|nr:F-box/WD repeat-containing protein 7 [Elysia marginata]
MYTVRSRFPELEFSPVSTFTTRRLRDKLVRLGLDTFHRVGSAHYQKDVDMQPLKLPLLLQQETNRSTQSIPNIFASQNSLDRLSTRRETQSQREASLKDKDRWIGQQLEESDDMSVSQDAVSRFVEMPVRRHMQEEQMSREARRVAQMKALRKKTNKSSNSFTSGLRPKRKIKWTAADAQSRDATTGRSEISKFSSVYTSASAGDVDELETARLPLEATQIMSWYINDWSDTKKNEFLHKLLLKLDPRQHYFISSFLSVKHHKDIVGLLPDQLALKILQYLSPKQLLVAGQVRQ